MCPNEKIPFLATLTVNGAIKIFPTTYLHIPCINNIIKHHAIYEKKNFKKYMKIRNWQNIKLVQYL